MFDQLKGRFLGGGCDDSIITCAGDRYRFGAGQRPLCTGALREVHLLGDAKACAGDDLIETGAAVEHIEHIRDVCCVEAAHIKAGQTGTAVEHRVHILDVCCVGF